MTRSAKSVLRRAEPRPDEHYMELALREAERAARGGEVPVGAVIVRDGKVLARAHNSPIRLSDPSAHAEVLALRRAARKLGNYRLEGSTLYATIEPCAMCAGAILLARVDRLVFGARDPKAGAVSSVLSVIGNPRLNHRPEVVSGILADPAARLLRNFFRAARKRSSSPGLHLGPRFLR